MANPQFNTFEHSPAYGDRSLRADCSIHRWIADGGECPGCVAAFARMAVQDAAKQAAANSVEAAPTWASQMAAAAARVPVEAVPEVAAFPLEPLEDICIIEQATEEKRASGLILAGGAQKLAAGRVVAAGPGRWYHGTLDASEHNSAAWFVPNPVKAGDFVSFGKYQSGGEPIEYEGKRYLMARAGDLGVRSKDGAPFSIRLWQED